MWGGLTAELSDSPRGDSPAAPVHRAPAAVSSRGRRLQRRDAPHRPLLCRLRHLVHGLAAEAVGRRLPQHYVRASL